MLRRALSFVLCLMFLFNFVIPVKAASDVCDHCGMSLGTYIVRDEQGQNSGRATAEGHVIEYYDQVFCIGCNDYMYSVLRESLESHNFSITVNLGHIGTINKHRYRSECAVCGYAEIHIVPCLYLECPG